MITISYHAKSQIETRAVCTVREVQEAVTQHLGGKQLKHREAKIIVKSLPSYVVLPDGSNGTIVIACVDTRTLVVKTVMLQRRSQVIRKSKVRSSEYIYLNISEVLK